MARRWSLPQAVLAASLGSSLVSGQQVLDLSNVKWTLTSPNYSNISVPAKFPSQAHLDLHAAKVIGDPLYGLNDFNLRWIANSNWTYTSAPLSGLANSSSNSSSTWLLFNGLDTFTSIELCGKHVASTDNQFRQYFFDVSNILKGCTSPVLSINFGSAPVIANKTAELPGQETWPSGVEGLFEFPNRQFIRKEQNDFGWDWGPAFAPAGPWLPAYVIQLGQSDVYARNVLVDIYREGQLNLLPPDQLKDWILTASIDYLGKLPAGAALNYQLKDGGSSVLSGKLSNVTSANNTITGSVKIPKGAVELWWPTGLGPQKLYNLTIDVVGSSNKTLFSVDRRTGFRTIVLNETPISQEQLAQGIAPGNNWHFEVNGHEFYAKGSNFIPPDPFWPTVTKDRMQNLFQSVVDGNQNMLRVWSSGAYSPDFMYDLADEMGILLWSEFEFGDALYPVDQAFLDNVKDEVNYQSRRVNHHPSLAFWAGGNELENLELKMVPEDERPRYTAEYEKLFLDTIVPILFANTRSISYSPSSTTNGWLSLDWTKQQPMTERYDNKTTGSIYGDTDHYNYDSTEEFRYSTYPVGRFANEFGYHSMPSVQTWQQAVDSADLNFDSRVIALRNHHYPAGGLDTDSNRGAQGMAEMARAINTWYPVPQKTEPLANFSAWCHTTQIFQAEFYGAQIQFYRKGSGLPERQLGSLYWQLEDQWQAPTWAGIEYDGRWKVLHYVAKDLYQPVIASAFYNESTTALDIWVTSDLWSPISASVKMTWYDWSGKRLNVSGTPASVNAKVGAINATNVFHTNSQPDLLNGIDPLNAILNIEVTTQATLPNSNKNQTLTHSTWYHASRLSETRLVDPGLQLSHSETTKKFTVKATKGVAAWVWLDYPAGALLNFDANAFWLLPGQQREVGYTVKRDDTGGKWASGVTVRSLWDNTVP